jgi:Glycosyl transferase family 8
MNSPSDGIVTGCDNGHQWMLPWWFYHLRKHNPDIPVTFCNFGGMTKECIDWCEANGTYCDLSNIKSKKNWFKKPAAIWYSNYKKVIWIDNDCEIKKPIDRYFAITKPNQIGVTYDPQNNFCINDRRRLIKNPVATGVVVAEPKNELIKEWAAKCLLANRIRGDQEVLNYILSERQRKKDYTTKIRIMPAEYQWLRIYNTINKDAYIMHWTGPEGKKHIKECIEKEKIENTF